MYEQLIASVQFKSNLRLTPVEDVILDVTLRDFPDAPADYVAFLREVGSGSFGECVCLYEGLIEPSFIYGNDWIETLADVMLFGDDFAGYCWGFDTKSWNVVEVDPGSRTPTPQAPDFATFITEKIRELDFE